MTHSSSRQDLRNELLPTNMTEESQQLQLILRRRIEGEENCGDVTPGIGYRRPLSHKGHDNNAFFNDAAGPCRRRTKAGGN